MPFVGYHGDYDQNDSVAERVRNLRRHLKRQRESLDPVEVFSTDSLALANSSASNLSSDAGSLQNISNHSCTDSTSFPVMVDNVGRHGTFRQAAKGLMRRRRRGKRGRRRRVKRPRRCLDHRCLCHLDPMTLHIASQTSGRLSIPIMEVTTSESSHTSGDLIQPLVDPVQPDVRPSDCVYVCLCVVFSVSVS